MKTFLLYIMVSISAIGLSCEQSPSQAKTLQSQITTTPIHQDTIPAKVDSPTKFDHPDLLGEWVVKEVTGNDAIAKKLYHKAIVSLKNDQRFKMTTSKKAIQTGFWKASAKGTKMRWIVKDVGMVKFDIEKIEANQVTLRLSNTDTQLIFTRQ